MTSGLSPARRELTSDHDPVAAAADGKTTLGEAPFDGTVSRAAYIPSTAVTGANTDTRTLTLVNRGQGGAGTTVVATLALASGVNVAADDARDMTLSTVTGATSVVEGDVLELVSTHAGSTGLADPGGSVLAAVDRA